MNDTRTPHAIARFLAYAAAFETAHTTDDWSVLEPFFTDDVVSELNGTPTRGRAAVLAALRDGVAMVDRRFDRRHHRIVVGPDVEDGKVHIATVVRYERAGIEPLELRGEEWFTFAGDRIANHVDRVVNLPEVMQYLGLHLDALRPAAAPRS